MTPENLTFERFIRTGFDGCSSAASGELVRSSDHPATTHVYRLDTPFCEVLNKIRLGGSTHVVFVDEIVGRLDEILSLVRSEFLVADDLVAMTDDSEASRKLHGRGAQEHALGSGVLAAGCCLAPWFLVVSRKYLYNNGLLDSKCQTLEFFLCELSHRLVQERGKRWLSAPLDLQVDYQLWARDILLQSSPRLASDFHAFERSRGPAKEGFDVPPQFRVRLVGDHTTIGIHDAPVAAEQPVQPLFSVICPAFKSKFFQQAVESVIGQTYSDWELVVIVDGPPDHERRIILDVLGAHASDRRVRFQVQENMGTGPTRRRLAQLAKGQFIVSIDDDDMFHAEVLDVFRRAIQQNPDADVIRAGTQLIGLSDQYLAPRQRTKVNGIACDIFEANQPFAISRRALAEVGGFEGDKAFGEAGEDSDLFLKIDATEFRVCLIDRPLYYRRLTTLNQTLSFSPNDCLTHAKGLLERHRPQGWRPSDIQFQKDGEFIKSAISYVNDLTNHEVVTATRFFDYQTLGDNRDVLIDLEITSLCNAACSFCPREVLNRSERFMSMDVVNILAEQLRREHGRRQVILCGIGESTLHPELTTIVRTLARTGTMVCMTTNGSSMNVEKFRELADAGMVQFNFSLNAATAHTHQKVMKMANYAQVEDNLLAILDHKKIHFPQVDIHASFVFCTDNQHEVADFVKRWRGTPVSKIWIHPVNGRAGLLGDDVTFVDVVALRKQFADDHRVLVDVFSYTPQDGNVCKIVQSLDFISVDGDMLLCALDYQRSVRLGNLRQLPLRELHLRKFLRYRRGEINGICTGCDFCPVRGSST